MALALIVAEVPKVKVVVDVAEREAAVVSVARDEAVKVVVPDNVRVPVVRVWVLLPKAIVVSVPLEASKVQVIPAPDPQVVEPISVLSKATVKVSVLDGVVSIPVPAAMVKVSPEVMVWLVPVSEPVTVKRVVAEVKTVPVSLGKVQVLSETVKSVLVMMPLKVAVAVPDWGLIWIVSELAVEEAKVAALVVVKVEEKAPED